MTAAAVYDFKQNPRAMALMRDAMVATRAGSIEPRKWYDSISEIEFGINRASRIAGFAKINAHKINSDGSIGDIAKNGQPNDIAQLLQSPYGGQRYLIERYFQYMKVEGDVYVVRCREGNEVVGYDVVGADEIEAESLARLDSSGQPTTDQPIRRIVLPVSGSGSNHEVEIDRKDFLGRIWRPSMKYVQLAASPLRALSTECRTLHLLTLNVIGTLLSRLMLNGIIYVPSEIADIRTGQPSGQNTDLKDNTVINRLIQAAHFAMEHFDKPEGATPIFMSGPGAHADNLKHIVMDRAVYETDMKLRAEAINRILTGLDVQKAKTSGDSENHWSSWSSSDDEMKVQIKPDLETFMWAITRLIMNREIQESGKTQKTADRYGFWYDLSAAQTVVSQAEDARQAIDRILIDGSTARKAMNFTDANAPVGDELVRIVGTSMGVPYLALWGTAQHEAIDWDLAIPPSKRKGSSEGDGDPEANPGNQPGKPGGKTESDTKKTQRPAA